MVGVKCQGWPLAIIESHSCTTEYELDHFVDWNLEPPFRCFTGDRYGSVRAKNQPHEKPMGDVYCELQHSVAHQVTRLKAQDAQSGSIQKRLIRFGSASAL